MIIQIFATIVAIITDVLRKPLGIHLAMHKIRCTAITTGQNRAATADEILITVMAIRVVSNAGILTAVANDTDKATEVGMAIITARVNGMAIKVVMGAPQTAPVAKISTGNIQPTETNTKMELALEIVNH